MDQPVARAVATSLDSQKSSWLNEGYFRHLTRVFGLAFADITAFTLAAFFFGTGHILALSQFFLRTGRLRFDHRIDVFVLTAIIFVIVRYLAGDYSRRQLFWDEARLTTVAVAVAAIPGFVLSPISLNAGAFFTETVKWSFIVVSLPALRQLTRFVMAKLGIWRLPTALVGSGSAAYDAYQTFSDSLSLGFDVRYIISDDAGAEVPSELRALTQIGLHDPTNIVSRLVAEGCEEVVIVSEDIERNHLDTLIHHLIAARLGVAIIPALGKLPLFGLSTNYFLGKNLLLLQVRNNLSRLPGRMIKRVFDFFGSLALLFVFSPLLAIIVVLIRRASDGPAIFEQPRVGMDGREFSCIKFRTMDIDAEEQLARWKREDPALYQRYIDSNFKLPNDPRVTAIGRWLRYTSLDELPQLVNVLRGEMSSRWPAATAGAGNK